MNIAHVTSHQVGRKAVSATKWSKLAVNVAGQLGLMVATGKWPPPSCPRNTMRGVDFYPRRDFIRALIAGVLKFKDAHGYVPSLASPNSFNEHIFVRKFFAPLPMPSLADKLAAKDHVKARLGDEFLPVVTWVGKNLDELIAVKPTAGRFALKANHSWNCNLFLSTPGDLCTKRHEIEQQTTGWLNSRYGYDWGEWQYCTFEPRLFLEEFIDFNGVETPDDYKIFCFYGKASLVEINVDRFRQLRSAFYTPDWNHIPVAYRHPPIQRVRPENLEDMIRVAETIAEGMEFARVDLYSDRKSRIKFGEITFSPGNACSRFSDFNFDLWLGTLFREGSRDPSHT